MKNILIILSFSFLLMSCSSKPESVVETFYKLLNDGKFEEAKKYATPSAIEYIDNLKAITAQNLKGDSLEFIIMDVKKKGSPKEGDTAIVNYKIGNFKSNVQLLWTDGSYKVFYTQELPSLRVVEYNSVELFNLFRSRDDVNIFWKKFGCYRLRLKNVLLFEAIPYYHGIPYVVKNNSTPILKAEGSDVKSFLLKFNGKGIEINGKGGKDMWGMEKNTSRQPDAFVLKSFSAPEESAKINIKAQTLEVGYGSSEVYDFNKVSSFEGWLSQIQYQQLYFDNCTIIY